MKPEELTEEQKTKLKSCKSTDELMSEMGTMGIELTDEQLDAVAGGGDDWDKSGRKENPAVCTSCPAERAFESRISFD